MMRTVLIASVLASCVQADDPDLGSTEQAAHCPVTGCGGNSPLLGPFRADELNEAGLANTAGLQLKGYVGRVAAGRCTPANPCRVDVQGDDLLVYEPNPLAPTGFDTHTGNSLTGGYLVVWQPGDPSSNPPIPPGDAKINISAWSNTAFFWQGPSSAIDSYELNWEIPSAALRGPVCGNPPPMTDGEGNVWVQRFQATFFAGDRYRHDRLEVIATTDAESGDWFNIACAGSATMKLHLNRHTTAGSNTAFNTTKSQRQTMLKMFTGDFCGDGTTWTVHGTRIEWRTNTGLSGYIGPGINSFESYWNEDGAVCMTRHRLASSTNPELAGMEAAIRGLAKLDPPRCRRLPQCNTSLYNGRAYYLRTSSAAMP